MGRCCLSPQALQSWESEGLVGRRGLGGKSPVLSQLFFLWCIQEATPEKLALDTAHLCCFPQANAFPKRVTQRSGWGCLPGEELRGRNAGGAAGSTANTRRRAVLSLGRILNKQLPNLAPRAQSFIKEESNTTQRLLDSRRHPGELEVPCPLARGHPRARSTLWVPMGTHGQTRASPGALSAGHGQPDEQRKREREKEKPSLPSAQAAPASPSSSERRRGAEVEERREAERKRNPS